MASLGLFGLYVLAVGGLLAKRLGAEYRGENLGQAPKAGKTISRASRPVPNRSRVLPPQANQALGRSGGLPGAGLVAAVIEKDLRALLRTLPLLWALGTPVLMVLILASLMRNGLSAAANPFSFAMPLCVAYALMGFTQLFYNNLGAEGEGIQILFLSPTPIRTVLLGKNIFHGLLFLMDALLAGLLCTLRLGRPDGVTIAATAAWVLFALPSNLAAGNVFSLTMPYRINPGRMRGSADRNPMRCSPCWFSWGCWARARRSLGSPGSLGSCGRLCWSFWRWPPRRSSSGCASWATPTQWPTSAKTR